MEKNPESLYRALEKKKKDFYTADKPAGQPLEACDISAYSVIFLSHFSSSVYSQIGTKWQTCLLDSFRSESNLIYCSASSSLPCSGFILGLYFEKLTFFNISLRYFTNWFSKCTFSNLSWTVKLSRRAVTLYPFFSFLECFICSLKRSLAAPTETLLLKRLVSCSAYTWRCDITRRHHVTCSFQNVCLVASLARLLCCC